MKSRSGIALLVALAVAATATAQTVTLTLDSSQDGQTVTPGTVIDWTITASVSTGDNQGLALVSTDLVQNAANPELFNIPPADGVPAELARFSRPAGISNPGEGGASTGYIGVQRGDANAQNLVQIGGAQNTFGQAGSVMGTDANVEGGIGQSGAVTVATGSFVAPATEGSYSFELQNALANVIETLNTPPTYSPVVAATVDTSAGSFGFTVQLAPSGCPGDCDCDGDIDYFDINYFLQAINGEQAWIDYHVAQTGSAPTCTYLGNCDVDQDGSVDYFDINPFLNAIGTTCP